ncbi:hypothetical protein EVAR_61192_1 [Eumeta japonica]|uniref:Uncharacterized protein n=1 Tax=Eumeta variegata TaxID=151549 RepID=A0A4C1YT66_EUMVA|nr:hypothetical protein EVAR_61192_1 [Eumeta japonica]
MDIWGKDLCPAIFWERLAEQRVGRTASVTIKLDKCGPRPPRPAPPSPPIADDAGRNQSLRSLNSTR